MPPLKNLIAASVFLSVHSLCAWAGDLSVFPRPSEINTPEFSEQPFAASPLSDVRSDRCDVLFSGTIEKGDLQKFETVFGNATLNLSGVWEINHNDGSFRFSSPVLCFDSPGGNIQAALEIADYLWFISDVSTRITAGSYCESACIFPFLTGNNYEEGENQDQFFDRVIEPGGILGIHAPSLNLSSEGTYSSAQITGAFNLAMQASKKVHQYGFQTDSNKIPFLGSYLFARFLETPSETMYRLDTVGDALLSGLPVVRYTARAPLDNSLVKTICDNAFMMDDGLFDWMVGPTWKSDSLLSAKDVSREFSRVNVQDILGYSDEKEEFITDKQTISSEVLDGTYFGLALSYPTGYPWTYTGCVVRVSYVGSSPNTLVRVLDDRQLDPMFFGVEVRTFPHVGFEHFEEDIDHNRHLSLLENANIIPPSEAWSRLDAEVSEGNNLDQHAKQLPWMAVYPFSKKISALPLTTDQIGTAGSDLADLTCDDLWRKRNLIFHENGYCFSGDKGKTVFGNDGCYSNAQTVALSEAEKSEVTLIKELEAKNGC